MTDSVIKYQSGVGKGTKVAAFDLDDTLVGAQGLTPFPGVLIKLKQLVKDGYNIVVISNQKVRHIGDKKLLIKLEKVAVILDVPILMFCAREEDNYRKPNIGILSLIPKEYGIVEFFVGDAAGRDGDHSDVDLGLAKNAGIPFYTPEKFFNTFKDIERNEIPEVLVMHPDINFLTLVLLMGYPGSGKSSYAKLLEETGNYFIVNNDTLKSMPKCAKECRRYLQNHQNVVVDNLNGTIETRKQFLDIGNELGATCIIIHVHTAALYML